MHIKIQHEYCVNKIQTIKFQILSSYCIPAIYFIFITYYHTFLVAEITLNIKFTVEIVKIAMYISRHIYSCKELFYKKSTPYAECRSLVRLSVDFKCKVKEIFI